MEIEDRIKSILEIKKVLTRINFMRQLEERCQILDIGMQRFFNKLEALYQKRFPNLLVINDKLSTWLDYSEKLMIIDKDSSKITGGRISMIGKEFLETFAYDLDIQYKSKHIFISKSTFTKYMLGTKFAYLFLTFLPILPPFLHQLICIYCDKLMR